MADPEEFNWEGRGGRVGTLSHILLEKETGEVKGEPFLFCKGVDVQNA